MLPNLGPAELIIILAIALIVFGPKKLPEIGRGIGSAMKEFQRARNDFMDSINSELDDPAPARSSAVASSSSSVLDEPAVRPVEYPEGAVARGSADALPYGTDFQPEGESQPSFRTGHAAEGHAA